MKIELKESLHVELGFCFLGDNFCFLSDLRERCSCFICHLPSDFSISTYNRLRKGEQTGVEVLLFTYSNNQSTT